MYTIKITNIKTKFSRLWTVDGNVRVTSKEKAELVVNKLNYGPMAGTVWVAEVVSALSAVA